MNRPLVSVVIPTFERKEFLLRAIRSVCRQTLTDFEIIVVDNSSTDGSQEAVQQLNLPNLSFYSVENHGIIGFSRNFGVSKAKGSFVAFLDSDDVWCAEKLACSVDGLIRHDADMVCHNMFGSWINILSFRSSDYRLCYRFLWDNGNKVFTSSVLIKKDLFVSLGGFSEDPAVRAWEDFELWLRVVGNQSRVIYLRGYFGIRTIGKHQLSTQKVTVKSLFNVRRWYDLKPEKKYPEWFVYHIGSGLVNLGKVKLGRRILIFGYGKNSLIFRLRVFLFLVKRLFL